MGEGHIQISLCMHVNMLIEYWWKYVNMLSGIRVSKWQRQTYREDSVFSGLFSPGRSFTAVTWQGATACWGKQMILSTDFSLLKNSLCSLCASLAAGEPDCVFVQWSAWYRAGASLCLSVMPLLKRTENYCTQVSVMLLLFCCRPWPRFCVYLNR